MPWSPRIRWTSFANSRFDYFHLVCFFFSFISLLFVCQDEGGITFRDVTVKYAKTNLNARGIILKNKGDVKKFAGLYEEKK